MTENTASALVVLSGGQDSTTVLFRCLSAMLIKDIRCLTFGYGQRHYRELESARKVVEIAQRHYGSAKISHEVLHLGPLLESTSPLVSGARLEQYPDWKSLPGGVEKTFVPLRNQLFITLAANRAVVHGCRYIYLGVSEEDYGGYPDCRERFLIDIENATNMGLIGVAKAIRIVTPLLHTSKADTVRMATTLPGCLEALAWSHTAYDGAYPPVGNDHATLLRAKGFEQAGIPDPLVLRAYAEGLMALPDTKNYYLPKTSPNVQEHVEQTSPNVQGS